MPIVYIPWDIVEYASECVFVSSEIRTKNLQRFQCPMVGSYDVPLTIVDTKGRIALWYLPQLLSKRQQVGRTIPPLCRC
jgi:hypothetical protein